MKNEYFIDGFEGTFSTLRGIKDHLNDSFTSQEKEDNFSNGGFIYHSKGCRISGGVPFEYINGKFLYHKNAKQPW